MSEKDLNEQNQNEEPVFKVADRRKFNLDGSLREGVSIEETKPKTEETFTAANTATAAPQNVAATTSAFDQTSAVAPNQAANTANSIASAFGVNEEAPTDFSPETADETTLEDQSLNETEIPGADNPASFANFVLSLASQAASALGMAEEPTTGQVRVNLQSGKYLIDVLGMLADKTSGNLHPLEQKLFSQLLGELRMQYVQIERMASEQRRRQEDQLLKQAQQKFSGKDILGR